MRQHHGPRLKQQVEQIARSILVGLNHFFRNAAIFDPNNEVFRDQARHLAAAVAQAHHLLGNCDFRVSRLCLWLRDFAVANDANLVEQADLLNSMLGKHGLSGLSFDAACAEPEVLAANIFSLYRALQSLPSGDPEAIRVRIRDMGVHKLNLIFTSDREISTASLADLHRARDFTRRNGLKLQLLLEDIQDQARQGQIESAAVGYRIGLNLLRVHAKHAPCLFSLLAVEPPLQRIATSYYTSLFWLLVLCEIPMPRGKRLQFLAESFFLCLAEVEEKRMVHRALLAGNFVNMPLFIRLVLLANMEGQGTGREHRTEMVDMLFTVWTFASKWRPGMDGGQCQALLTKLMQWQDPRLSQTTVVLLGHLLNRLAENEA